MESELAGEGTLVGKPVLLGDGGDVVEKGGQAGSHTVSCQLMPERGARANHRRSVLARQIIVT